MQTIKLFPTLIWKRKVDNFDSLNQNILDNINRLMKEDNRDSRRKWHSERLLMNHEFMSEINEQVIQFSHDIIKMINIKYDGNIKITGAWVNASPPGIKHHVHSHPNNYLSGVYYVRAHPGADTINFLDPRMVVGLIRPPIHQHNELNSESVTVDIKAGELCFFPHWLRHSVNENTSQEDRISIAFNVMFEDYVNKMSMPMW